VGPGNVLKDIIDALPGSTVRLTQVFRQAADSEIVRNAHRICLGQMPLKGNAETRADGAFFHIGAETAIHAQEQLLEVVCNRLPEAYGAHPIDDIQVLSPMHRGDCGIEALNRMLQQHLNPNGEEVQVGDRLFRVGDKLIQLRNDYQREVFNGEIGRLFLVDRKNNLAKVQFEGRLITYELREMYQLALAYCISIHKSQGSEFPLVVIPITTQHHIMLQRNLIYTAITRARNLVCVIGQPNALRRAVTNAQPMLRHTGLSRRLNALVRQLSSNTKNI
jgi:exodeoxyribonuclease V alpha subunit